MSFIIPYVQSSLTSSMVSNLALSVNPIGFKSLMVLYIIGNVNENIRNTIVDYISVGLVKSLSSITSISISFIWNRFF
jgi:hypothetical protein